MANATKIAEALDKMGWDTRIHYARETRSTYISAAPNADGFDWKGGYIVIRVSDHDEVYPPAVGERQIDLKPGQWAVLKARIKSLGLDAVEPYKPDPELVEQERREAAHWSSIHRAQAEQTRDAQIRKGYKSWISGSGRVWREKDGVREWLNIGKGWRLAK